MSFVKASTRKRPASHARRHRHSALCTCLFGVLLPAAFFLPAVAGEEPRTGPLLQIMEQELRRSMDGLRDQGENQPYYISFRAKECDKISLTASLGVLKSRSESRHRHAGVQVRIGSYDLDNTHRLKGRSPFFRDFSAPGFLPLENDPLAVRSALWKMTDKAYRQAVERFVQVKTDLAVSPDEEDKSADFTREEPVRSIGGKAPSGGDFSSWEENLRKASAIFRDYPGIYDSSVSLSGNASTKYFVNSEGAVIRQPAPGFRVSVSASTRTEDGMNLRRTETFEARSPGGLPDFELLASTVKKVGGDLEALKEAPVIEPYTGPAILSGEAAAVFFHEIFGHRIEGHRQKDEKEGQTFTRKIGEAVLPDFISVYDDPTMERFVETDLGGHYLYDDEGVSAERVVVVDGGVLKNFLMSRSPVAGFKSSNGHGRGGTSNTPVGRQGNLIVESSKSVPEEELRSMLIEELGKQEKPFGLYFAEIEGGYTRTRRGGPQSFMVSPVMVYKIFADGRPDELIQGAELIGTPLISFARIIASGDKTGVFNGTCGAESGWISVSAVSPSILTATIEVQKREKSSTRPPFLPPPDAVEEKR